MTLQDNPYAKRILWILFFVLLFHIVFFLLSKRISIFQSMIRPTEMISLSQEELAALKKQILASEKNKPKRLPVLMENEMDLAHQVKVAPKDAKFMGKFNQEFKEQMVAGPTRDVPQDGKSQPLQSQKKPQEKTQKNFSLSQLGLGEKINRMKARWKNEPENSEKKYDNSDSHTQSNASNNNDPFHPVGREVLNFKRGNANFLNAAENQYYSFFVRFEDPIVKNWYFLLRSNEDQIEKQVREKNIRSGVELPVTIEFAIDRNGNFTEINVIESSGISMIDWATKMAVQKLGSLPNPPQGLFEGKNEFREQLRFGVYLNR